ncbi:maleate cis-trans isomerase family protein [Aeromicrobium sp.]|uniref:maleate cis-trans isomerase family protein n=1 Tax=Aeromicrobium sp. TaxID=1871063 RepID=UPI003D6AFFE2
MTAIDADHHPRIGMVTPYDFALDRELWRWVPEPLELLLTRTEYEPLLVSVEQALAVGDPDVVARATRTVITPAPAVVGYACTTGSFVGGRKGEQALLDAILGAGAPAAVTTSGAVVQALTALGVSRVAVATPYEDEITALLVSFLQDFGVDVTATSNLGLNAGIWTVPDEVTLDLVRRAWTDDCDAVFVSCTNLSTYDLIPTLEAELGVPVVSANQATMWAAVARAGFTAVGPGQRLIDQCSIDGSLT